MTIRTLAGVVLDAILPQSCVGCQVWIRGAVGSACPACAAAIEAASLAHACPRCARTVSPLTFDGRGCGFCRGEDFWNVAGVVRVAPYHVDPVAKLLTGLKYGGRMRNADFLGGLLARAIRSAGWAERLDALVPVPMHWRRRLQRPCDHARLLAQAAGGRLGLPVRRAVRRTRYAPSQTEIRLKTARFQAVAGCFSPARRARVAGRVVCIVDNLLMSGATVCEVSKALRRAGARVIYAAVVARSVLPGHPGS